MMGGRRILSDDQLDEMAELREQGWSSERIARHFVSSGTPVSAASVYSQCLRVGADLPPPLRGRTYRFDGPYQRGNHVVRPFTEAEDAQLLALEAQGLSVAEIARRIDRQPNSTRQRIRTLARREARREDAA